MIAIDMQNMHFRGNELQPTHESPSHPMAINPSNELHPMGVQRSLNKVQISHLSDIFILSVKSALTTYCAVITGLLLFISPCNDCTANEIRTFLVKYATFTPTVKVVSNAVT